MENEVFVPSRGISNLNEDYNNVIAMVNRVFVPSRGISNLNCPVLPHVSGQQVVFVPSRGISNLNTEEQARAIISRDCFRPLPGHI